MKVFKNARIYVEGHGVVKTDMAFDEKITALGGGLCGEEISLPENAVVVPGFIDEHIHGAMGSDGMDGTIKDISTISETLVKEGTVAFLVTTMTQSVDNISKALNAVNEYIGGRLSGGAEVLGVHLEGPFISVKHVGAQPIEYVQSPSKKAFDVYNEASGGNVKIVTLAPEVEGADELIPYLKKKGIVASIGHTDATFEQVEKAKELGATNITHTFNAQTPLHHRKAGVVGAAMLDDDLVCEVICDTIHVSVPAMKLLVKSKPSDKVVLITDSMRAKRLPDGISELGGQTVIVKNGEARLENGALAGSVLKMNDAVKNMVEKVGVDFCTAVDFASANPAKSLGLYAERGSIAIGKRADFTVLDDKFNVIATYVGGVKKY
ncbi:MAG: N-acetylglucosamine-6-phosphate deacetylase [Clostridia bacterium]|nr:N-acetylglucosamine-6-phosphate deacetylase [Clostridia bacterium]